MAVLENTGPKIPPNIQFQGCIKVLFKHNQAYEVDIHPTAILPHMRNRGGLLLSPHNLHRNGGRIHKVGADLKQLTNAYGIELAEEGELRAANISANESLVNRSNGLLAPVTGAERFLSLGCGHTAGFCKACYVPCKTTEASIANDEGLIDVEKIKKDRAFKTMIEVGWKWTIVRAIVDREFPGFSKLAQRALNTSNHIATEVGELETCCTVADIIQDHSKDAKDNTEWREVATAAIEQLNLPCAAYSQTLVQFVHKFSGGVGAPLIRFMDTVAKQSSCTQVLGETFWSAVTYMKFVDGQTNAPWLRIALILCNLASPKVEDGVARTLVKSDCVKVVSRGKLAEVIRTEKVLRECNDIKDSLVKSAPNIDVDKATLAMGQAFVRIALLLCSKQLMGNEKKERTMPEIQSMYLSELSGIALAPVSFTGWDLSAVPPAPSTAPKHAPSSAPSVLESFEDLTDPKKIAAAKGFKVGMKVYQKGVNLTNDNKVFVITSIDDKGVELKKLCIYSAQGAFTGTEPLLKFVDEWTECKLDLPFIMVRGERRPKALSVDIARAEILIAVHKCDAQNKCKHVAKLVFWRKPDQLRTADKGLDKHDIVLCPLVHMSQVLCIPQKGNLWTLGFHDVLDESLEFCLVPPAKPPVGSTLDQQALVGAFWWVNTTSDKAAANMELFEKKVDGVDVPMMRNFTAVPPFTELCRYVPPAKPSVRQVFSVAPPVAKRARR